MLDVPAVEVLINYLDTAFSIENRDPKALSLVKSIMCSKVDANSRHRLTRPSEEKYCVSVLETSL